MIFSFFGSHKPLTPVEAGEIVAIKFPIPSAVVPEVRILYATVSKVSKKRNIFVQFVSKDKGEDLQVGIEGTLTALKSRTLIEFPTRFLHKDGDAFIFAPPMSVQSAKVPSSKKGLNFETSFPVDYRALSSPYPQRGTLTEFSRDEIGFIASLLIPVGTGLRLEFVIPYRQDPVHMKGKVRSCEPAPDQIRKFSTRLTLETMSPKDRDDLINYFLLTKQPHKSGPGPINDR